MEKIVLKAFRMALVVVIVLCIASFTNKQKVTTTDKQDISIMDEQDVHIANKQDVLITEEQDVLIITEEQENESVFESFVEEESDKTEIFSACYKKNMQKIADRSYYRVSDGWVDYAERVSRISEKTVKNFMELVLDENIDESMAEYDEAALSRRFEMMYDIIVSGKRFSLINRLEENDAFDYLSYQHLIREQYIVDLINITLASETRAYIDDWKYNLQFLQDNYGDILKIDSIHLVIIDNFIEDYTSQLWMEDMMENSEFPD